MNIQPIGIRSQYNNSKNSNKTSFGSNKSTFGFDLDTLMKKTWGESFPPSGKQKREACTIEVYTTIFNKLSELYQRFLNEPAVDIHIMLEERIKSPADIYVRIEPSDELSMKYIQTHKEFPSHVFAPYYDLRNEEIIQIGNSSLDHLVERNNELYKRLFPKAN